MRLAQSAYHAYAAGYAQILDPTLAGEVELLVDLARVEPGKRLLDLATGTGSAARAAARRGASVTGIDFAPAMVAVARELSGEIDFRVANAEALPFDDDEFDAVTCGLSLSHFAEVDKALGEVRRVLSGSGTFVASSWGERTSIPWARTLREVREHYVQEQLDDGLDEDTWLDPHLGCEVLSRAGFGRVSVRTEAFTGTFDAPEQALRWSLTWPVAAATVDALRPRSREALLADPRPPLAGCDLSWSFAFNFYVARPSAVSPRRSRGASPETR